MTSTQRLIGAISNNSIEDAVRYIRRGANPLVIDYRIGRTAIGWASFCGQHDILNMLIDYCHHPHADRYDEKKRLSDCKYAQTLKEKILSLSLSFFELCKFCKIFHFHPFVEYSKKHKLKLKHKLINKNKTYFTKCTDKYKTPCIWVC